MAIGASKQVLAESLVDRIYEAAVQMSPRAETVRNQVKSILNKTGCRRQVELTRMLTQLMPTGR
jgi:DNA-binding CsgD family transcriptional regulator